MPPSAEDLLDALGAARRSSLAEFRASGAVNRPTRPLRAAQAWWRYATGRGVDDPMTLLDPEEQRALSKASGAAGAFLVPADLEQQILTVARARGSVSKLARTFLTDSGDKLSVSIGGTHGTAAWIAEAGTISPSDEAFLSVDLVAYKAASSVVLSEELATDSLVAFDAYLATELGARIAQLEGAAFATGSGTGQPKGFVSDLTQVTAGTGSSTTFTLVDLVTALHTVAPDYRSQGGAWIGSDGALKMLRNVKDSAGAPILLNAGNPGDPPMLLGYPLYVDENMAAPAANAKSLAFAGWEAAYAIRRVAGVSVTRQVELYSNAGSLGYRAVHRVGGAVLIPAAGVVIAHSAT